MGQGAMGQLWVSAMRQGAMGQGTMGQCYGAAMGQLGGSAMGQLWGRALWSGARQRALQVDEDYI